MIRRESFPRDVRSVASARRFVAGLLGEADQATRERVLLMVSELATNAVQHARTGFDITAHVDGEALRIEVTDTGPGRPRQQDPAPTEPSGRGLLIIDALADQWGIVEAPAGPGTTVWFRLEAESPKP